MQLRNGTHSTLTETATLVVSVLKRIPGVKMIAPGEIKKAGRRKGGGRHLTVVYTSGGCELIITGQSVQKIAVHTITDAQPIIAVLRQHKKLQSFTVSERTRKPGI